MPLLTLIDAQLAFGDLPLLDRAELSVEVGERLGLIGRNGTGKSSLLATIDGRRTLDDGEVRRLDGLRIASVEQEPSLPAADTLHAALVLRGHLGEPDHDAEDHAATLAATAAASGVAVPAHGVHLDDRERWRALARLDEYLQRFGVDGDRPPETASGGERKRAALALALALSPDLLLLDEPTNHLDIDAIGRLEALLVERGSPTLIVITHDRAFLDKVATRILELDRGVLRSYPGNFATYQLRKGEQLAAEATASRRFDKFWAQEEVWIRKGVEARRTRNAGRVKRLEHLRDERVARRERIGQVKLAVDAGERSGKRVAEMKDVAKAFEGRAVVSDLSLLLSRGDRVGLIGPNGAGKTTLIRLLLGELAPDRGTVERGTNVQVAYFDQLREVLDPERTVAETIAPGSDWIEIGGNRKHVMSYLADFLFPPRRAQAPVKTLSGGERNRLLLARLFARPANVLVLDEPTNDLDIESLELLEDTLQDYPGTLIVVSHDRAFLDAVVTQTWVAEGEGRWREYPGGFADWTVQRSADWEQRWDLATAAGARAAASHAAQGAGGVKGASQVAPTSASTSVTTSTSASTTAPRKAKLSFKEARELEALPATIAALETEQSTLQARMAAADYHQQGAAQRRDDAARLAELERLHAQKFARWAVLEERAGGA